MGTDLSAVSGARTEGGGGSPPRLLAFGLGIKALNPPAHAIPRRELRGLELNSGRFRVII